MTTGHDNDASSLVTIDDSSGVPIWLQLRNRLVYLIKTGALKEGDRLPTVREMAVAIGINYNTVSKVYQDIERDGYIASKRGFQRTGPITWCAASRRNTCANAGNSACPTATSSGLCSAPSRACARSCRGSSSAKEES